MSVGRLDMNSFGRFIQDRKDLEKHREEERLPVLRRRSSVHKDPAVLPSIDFRQKEWELVIRPSANSMDFLEDGALEKFQLDKITCMVTDMPRKVQVDCVKVIPFYKKHRKIGDNLSMTLLLSGTLLLVVCIPNLHFLNVFFRPPGVGQVGKVFLVMFFAANLLVIAAGFMNWFELPTNAGGMEVS